MIYIAYLKMVANTVVDLHLKDLARSGSVTLLSDTHAELTSRFNMVPASEAIKYILKEQWALPYSKGTKYQIRRLSGPERRYTALFKQDPRGNRLAVIMTYDLTSGHSTGSYFGYNGSPDGFFTMLKELGLLPSDFESTMCHELD